MPLSVREKDRICDTVFQITASPHVEKYVVGFTGRSLKERFAEYRPLEYEHMILLYDKLSRADALDLEEYLFKYTREACDIEAERHVYEKYDEMRRDGPYRASYGGTGDPDSLSHSVYVTWWAPYV